MTAFPKLPSERSKQTGPSQLTRPALRYDTVDGHEQCSNSHDAHGRGQGLLNLSQLPGWMRDNDFLRTGYRPQALTIWSCVTSGLLQLTNDSINIYTHLIGFLMMLPISYYLLVKATSLSNFEALLEAIPLCKSPASTSRDIDTVIRIHGLKGLSCLNVNEQSKIMNVLREHKYAMTPLLLAGILCLLFSTTYHLFWVLSPRVMKHLAKLDFSGIACLCAGHGMTGLYYTYYCSPHLARPFYIMMAIAFTLIVPVIMSPRLATPQARSVRGCLFTGLGALSLFPVLRALINMKSWADIIAVSSALVSMIMYGIGGFIYVTRFPECCRVGKHDRFFASHQLMHVLVLLGIATHLSACYYLLHLRLQYGCSVPKTG